MNMFFLNFFCKKFEKKKIEMIDLLKIQNDILISVNFCVYFNRKILMFFEIYICICKEISNFFQIMVDVFCMNFRGN